MLLHAASLTPEVLAAIMHGVLVGPVAPTREERSRIAAPALILAHSNDLLHPFNDARNLAGQLPNAELVRARSPFELRFWPQRLTDHIAEFLRRVWEPARERPWHRPFDGYRRVTARSLSGEDVALLCAAPRGTQLQIGALCFFEAAPLRDERGRLRLAELRSHVDSRLDALPRFRQRIAPVLGDLAAPVWVDDTGFDVARHTPRVELPAPGGAAALREFMDHLLSEPMDLAHPLWDIHVIEGVDVEVVAIVLRAHHVMADGLALHAAATLLLDAVPRPPRRRVHDWSPERVPGSLRLSATALADRTCRQVGIDGRHHCATCSTRGASHRTLASPDTSSARRAAVRP